MKDTTPDEDSLLMELRRRRAVFNAVTSLFIFWTHVLTGVAVVFVVSGGYWPSLRVPALVFGLAGLPIALLYYVTSRMVDTETAFAMGNQLMALLISSYRWWLRILMAAEVIGFTLQVREWILGRADAAFVAAAEVVLFGATVWVYRGQRRR